MFYDHSGLSDVLSKARIHVLTILPSINISQTWHGRGLVSIPGQIHRDNQDKATDSFRLIATLGSGSSNRKVSKKDILSVEVVRICGDISSPEVPMALRLQSNLL